MNNDLALKNIKVISFDGDDTLWDFQKVMIHSLNIVIRELKRVDPIAAERLNIKKLIDIRERVFSEFKGKVTNLEKIRLESFKESLRKVNRENDELAEMLNKIYLKHRFEDIELYDEVLPTINHLKDKYILGLISNGNSYPERCGLKDIFEFVVFSQDVGVEKPDQRIFNYALKQLDCEKDQIIHVGNSIEDDIIGAEQAGITGVWLNRNCKKTDGYKPEYEINSLDELQDIL
ncbi:MAG: HAD family hydrolase [Thermoplasmatota archaeon]